MLPASESSDSWAVNIVTFVPEVMDGYLGMLTDDFILVVDISCGEVDHDINDEHYIDWNNLILGYKDICFLKSRL